MTFIEAYEAIPYADQRAIEDLEMNAKFAEQCLDTILEIAPDREMALKVLVEQYAEHVTLSHDAKNALIEAGYDEQQIFQLSIGFFEKNEGMQSGKRYGRKSKSAEA